MMNMLRLWCRVAMLGVLLASVGGAGLVIGTRHLPVKVGVIVLGLVAALGALLARQAVTTGRNRG